MSRDTQTPAHSHILTPSPLSHCLTHEEWSCLCTFAKEAVYTASPHPVVCWSSIRKTAWDMWISINVSPMHAWMTILHLMNFCMWYIHCCATDTLLTLMKGSSKVPLYTPAIYSAMQAFPLFFSAECGNQENEDNLHSYVYHHELGC